MYTDRKIGQLLYTEVIKLAAIDKINGISTQQFAINTAGAQTQQVSASESTVDSVQKSAPEKVYVQSDGTDEQQKGSEDKTSKSTNDEIKKAVDELNKKMINQDSEAIFGIHDKTNRITIKIVDKKTKEVIKELPPEKTLDMLARVWEMAGILVDEKR